MTKRLLAATIIGGAILALSPRAEAAFTPTDSTWWTVATPGTFTFTFLGFSAGDTDVMHFVFNGQTIFVNNASTLGEQVSVNVGPGTYKLSLVDVSFGGTWSSDPSMNSDGVSHLAYTSDWSDFNLGALPGVAGNTAPYYGWADRALSPQGAAHSDYNDLVFSETFTPVPEPTSMALLAAGLMVLGIGRVRRV